MWGKVYIHQRINWILLLWRLLLFLCCWCCWCSFYSCMSVVCQILPRYDLCLHPNWKLSDLSPLSLSLSFSLVGFFLSTQFSSYQFRANILCEMSSVWHKKAWPSNQYVLYYKTKELKCNAVCHFYFIFSFDRWFVRSLAFNDCECVDIWCVCVWIHHAFGAFFVVVCRTILVFVQWTNTNISQCLPHTQKSHRVWQ